VATTSHLAELEIRGPDVVGAWKALEPVLAACAELFGTPATKSDYHVTNWDDQGTVTAADLRDGLDRVASPKSISVTYTTTGSAGLDSCSIELTIMRYRRFKELNVHIRVSGPMDVRTLGLFEQTRMRLARAIDSASEP
jgi:hypothetical protein